MSKNAIYNETKLLPNNPKLFNNNNNNNNNKVVPFNNNEKFNNNFNKYNNINNSNNNSSRALVPYQNPHEGRLHSLRDSQVCDDFYNRCDVDDYDEYVRNLHEYESYNNTNYDNNDKNIDDNAYDYGEIFGNRPESIEGISPGYNVTQNLNAIDNIDSRNFPCFDELNNRCLKGAKDCKYSHDVKDLQREAIKRYQDAEKSKYLPREYRQPPTHPTSILKRKPVLMAMDTVNTDCESSSKDLR
jgi:hypothetical protein